MITDASVDKFKECDKNLCTVSINLHDTYKYVITVMPMASHVVLSYKTLQYKVPPADDKAYGDLIDFLTKAIDGECCQALDEDIERGEYWPDREWEHAFCCLRVHCHGVQVFYHK
ncbi:hypothetical protein MNEG_14695 [Monoraphidium neglectum]|jgi:hypothetical protein|uniref:Uncharacterized protein n=1 Tax=Monoraphidium neglectum TaxID=145388 RepID=A0A0D2IZJ4_9CHLO|nr:hypothetical protein MNEG_14695 [Monoraphidium neglectum]KIY93267.1 hypothetical protein MNEG_14695 [Monoraphidium neglectum]|eukprot:XP_013892287.1 hypothetical protein MNEG_14695 [Monoraphidium neglectum]